ncbi:hypothetical protein M422DRAFT_246149 [Sphaerobolus stellatus SS14]|nr:hypothetical protein M422DRAFT_246149 [Sphaerobolus stellatus SS14]
MQHPQSRAFISEDGIPQPVELFIVSSTIIERTRRVLMTTLRTSRTASCRSTVSARTTSPGTRRTYEQPDSVVTTICRRINLDADTLNLDGLKAYLPAHRHSAVLIRAIFEELTELPVAVELASDFLDRKTPIFRDDVCVYPRRRTEAQPLALIDENMPVTSDSLYPKVPSSLKFIIILELLAKADHHLQRVTTCPSPHQLLQSVPKTVDCLRGIIIINVIPLQIFSYYLPVMNGFDGDFPRNL